MKQISLIRMLLRNFKSYSECCIEFPQNVGLNLFNGQNLVEPRLGANGSGKSSLLEGICWNWYGAGVKGAKTSSVLSWDQTQVEVLTEISVNGVLHTIYRNGPPMKVELDEKVATQEQVDQLLGITKERFLHSVMFGQAAPLFPDLSISDRGELLDDVLQLNIWQKSSEAATKKASSLEKEMAEKRKDLSYIEGQLAQIETEASIKQKFNSWEEKKGEELHQLALSKVAWDTERDKNVTLLTKQSELSDEKHKEELEAKVAELDALEHDAAQTDVLITTFPDIPKVEKFEQKVKHREAELVLARRKHAELDTERKLTIEPRDFWLKNNRCPTCLQDIVDEIKANHLEEIDTKEQELVDGMSQLDTQIEKLKVELEKEKKALNFTLSSIAQQREQKDSQERRLAKVQLDITKVEKEIQKVLNWVNPFTSQIETMNTWVNPYQGQIISLENQINPFIDLLVSTSKKREDLENKRDILVKETKQVESSIVAAEYWKHGFKRIRLYFVQQVLEALQIEIQSAISALGLEGWSIKLATEQETKSGSVKLGVQLNVKSPTSEGAWGIFSGGESQRLRLAIAMGLASLIQRASGSWFNFTMFDEPTSWLSTEGIEDLLLCLEYWSSAHNKSVWIVDHRALQHSSFSEIWVVIKDENGSRIEKVHERSS